VYAIDEIFVIDGVERAHQEPSQNRNATNNNNPVSPPPAVRPEVL